MGVKQMKARLRQALKGKKRRIGLGFSLKLPLLMKILDDGASN